jgi:hypothetical protein
MRKYLSLLLLLVVVPTSVFAQDDDDDWRRRRAEPRVSRHAARVNAFELTPFVGYRWGGTIFASETFLFDRDVDVASSANFGISLGPPPGRQRHEARADGRIARSSELETESGLFEPNNGIADIDVTYLHAGSAVPVRTLAQRHAVHGS